MIVTLLRSKTFHSLIGVLVSVGLLVWIFFQVEWKDVAREVANMHFLIFIPCTLIFILHYILRALRWHFLLPSLESKPSTRTLFDSILVGTFVTFIAPLRAGEFVRPYFLSRLSDYSFSTGFTSVVVERFFDLVVVLFSFWLVTNVVPGIPPWVHLGAQGLGLLALGIFAFLVVGSFLPNVVMAPIKFITIRLPAKLGGLINNFCSDLLRGASVLKRPKALLMTIFLSLCVWSSGYLLFHFFFLLFGLNPSVWASVTVAVIVALAVAAPSAPGFIGVYQTACIAGFALFHLDSDIAVAYSIVTHLFQYVIFVLYGVFVLTRYNLKLSQLRAAASAGS